MSSSCGFVLDMMIKCLNLLVYVSVFLYNCENKREHVLDKIRFVLVDLSIGLRLCLMMLVFEFLFLFLILSSCLVLVYHPTLSSQKLS
ncbi:hypothetical protein RHGRI_025915 [Rhododendron griersonianum]|uniref:Uncharacterized protein n=1 Tax=Rhododendron griersonianum TaxID=479676 RepID=A0AAV6IS84_9ERIC|nr:hypothetical protein RHGRI_025915 [Rhododendron griersonianum]